MYLKALLDLHLSSKKITFINLFLILNFFAATIQGIRVSGFSIGFGPAIIKKEFKGVYKIMKHEVSKILTIDKNLYSNNFFNELN